MDVSRDRDIGALLQLDSVLDCLFAVEKWPRFTIRKAQTRETYDEGKDL